jgi:microcystin-dependent protein
MFRIAGAGVVQDEQGHNIFTSEDVPTARPPTEITAKFLNDVQEEIAGTVEGLGFPLSVTDNNQLLAALRSTFAAKNTTIHHIKDVWQIVDNLAALEALNDVPDSAEVIVTDNNGAGIGMAYYSGGWNVQPLTVNNFDLYGTTFDGHGYYWFAEGWRIFDIEALETSPASEEELGIVKLATLAQVLAMQSLEALAVRPGHLFNFGQQLVPPGTVIFYTGKTPPTGYIEAAGQLLLRADYPGLFNHALASGNIFTEANWATNTGGYSTGDGVTNFRVPNLRGEFLRGADNGRGVDTGRVFGSVQGDAIRNITGTIRTGTRKTDAVSDNTTGAFKTTATGAGVLSYNAGGVNALQYEDRTFDASNVVPTASQNRPRNGALLACIKS